MSSNETEEAPFEWAIVEIMGHRKHAGRVIEEEKFGAKMLRVDVPTLTQDPPPHAVDPEDPAPASPTFSITSWRSHWYGGSSIFSFTLTDEATVLRMNRSYVAPQRYLPSSRHDHDDFGYDPDEN